MVFIGHMQCSGVIDILHKAIGSFVQEHPDTVSMSTGSCNVKTGVTSIAILLV